MMLTARSTACCCDACSAWRRMMQDDGVFLLSRAGWCVSCGSCVTWASRATRATWLSLAAWVPSPSCAFPKSWGDRSRNSALECGSLQHQPCNLAPIQGLVRDLPAREPQAANLPCGDDSAHEADEQRESPTLRRRETPTPEVLDRQDRKGAARAMPDCCCQIRTAQMGISALWRLRVSNPSPLHGRLHAQRLGTSCVVDTLRKASTGGDSGGPHWPERGPSATACRAAEVARHDEAGPGLGGGLST